MLTASPSRRRGQRFGLRSYDQHGWVRRGVMQPLVEMAGFFSHAWVLHANAGERGAREWAGSFRKEVEGCVAEAESLWTAPLREAMQMGAQD